MKKRILALALTTVMALSTLVGVLVAHKMTIEPVAEETDMVIDEEPSRAVLAANYTQEDLDRVAKEALDIINNIRKENGLSPYTSKGGNFISAIRAEEIVTDFSHESASLDRNKYGLENCARTNSLNAQHVVDLWMNSAGHKRAILSNDGFHYAQLAVVEKNGRYYWVSNFFGDRAYEARLAEYENGMYRQEEKAETKDQPSFVTAEVKPEEQKPSTAQEVKQEVKPEEQKPVTTPETKQEVQERKPEVKEEHAPASKAVETTKEETQTPAASTTPSIAAQEEKSNTPQQETKQESKKGQATAEKQEEIPGLTIYYDKETDQRYEIIVAPGQSREEAFREQASNQNSETEPSLSSYESLPSYQEALNYYYTTKKWPSTPEESFFYYVGSEEDIPFRVTQRTVTSPEGKEFIRKEGRDIDGNLVTSWIVLED